MTDIGKNIKKLRSGRDVTQEQLAEALSVTRQAVSSWETGKTQPDIETMQQIAGFFEVSVEELIYGPQKKRVFTGGVTGGQVKGGVSFGMALAMIVSYVNWHSIGWAIFHGLLNWVYIIYFVIKYGFN